MSIPKRTLILALACCLSLLSVSALADEVEMEPREIWKNAEYVDGSFRNLEEPQAQEVAVMMEGALQTSQSAVKKAQALFADPALGFEATDDSIWTAWPVKGSRFNRVDWQVRGKRGEETVVMNLAMDGSGAWNVSMETDPFFTHELLLSQDPMDNLAAEPCDLDALVRFCLDFAEKMEPGETKYFYSIKYYGFVTDGDTLYVMLEAPYTEDHNTSKSFVVALENGVFRIVDYYSGNG